MEVLLEKNRYGLDVSNFEGEAVMPPALFTNGYVWDGHATERFAGEVLLTGDRIKAVGIGWGSLPREGAEIIDASDATVIPGLIEAHGHLSFAEQATYTTQAIDTPPEETLLITLHNARTLLDAGFTGVIGAGSPKLRTEVVIRNEIDAGRIPGPRLYASTPTITVTGGLNDDRQLHQYRDITSLVADGPTEMRRAVRLGYREGVDIIKLNISGDDFFPRPTSRTTTMSEVEVAAAVEVAHGLGLRVSAHARSTEAVKIAVRCGVDLVNHADFADEEALDLLEEARDRVFVIPTIGYLHNLMHEAESFGFNSAALERMALPAHLESSISVHSELRRRGVRALIGGDYGLPWQPHGTNARDAEHLVNYLGYRPVDALRCATRNGAEAVGRGHELGRIRPGYYADLLLVKGDPTEDVRLLQDRSNLLAIVINGRFHKSPVPANGSIL